MTNCLFILGLVVLGTAAFWMTLALIHLTVSKE